MTVPAREHVGHVDVLRLLPMVGVVATHTLIYTQPPESAGSNAALMFLHANREVFFFVSAFVLFYASGAATTALSARDFWRRRYPLVVLPYVGWTLIYWLQTSGWAPWNQGCSHPGIRPHRYWITAVVPSWSSRLAARSQP